MKTNADITIYNKYIANKAAVYQRVNIQLVAWENRKAVNVIRSGGNISADQARIFIPFARGKDFLSPKAWQALENKAGKWTLQIEDVIVKGTLAVDISGATTLSVLKENNDDVLVITSVDTMDIGSTRMHHWQVGAK